MEDALSTFLAAFITVLLGIFLGALVYGTIIHWLWNWLMPMIFGLPTITWLEGYGLSILGSCLFPKSTVSVKK